MTPPPFPVKTVVFYVVVSAFAVIFVVVDHPEGQALANGHPEGTVSCK